MPISDGLIVSVAGRMMHPWDFAFYKNNGEIANQIRIAVPSIREIKLDEDGDVNIRTPDMGTFFATPSGVAGGGWLTDSRSLSQPNSTEEYAQTMDSIFKAKGSFVANSYSVRLFFRFTPENGLKLIGAGGLEVLLQSILGDKIPSDVESYKFSAAHDKDGFSDFVELEASVKDVQLRYSREKSEHFDSYSAFLSSVDLPRLIEDLRPFSDVLVAAQPKPRNLRPSLFGEKK
jgi:hypothetical protein